MQKLNVYSFSVHRKSQQAMGNHLGDTMAVVAATAAEASTELREFAGDDLAGFSGPTVIFQDALVPINAKLEVKEASEVKEVKEYTAKKSLGHR